MLHHNSLLANGLKGLHKHSNRKVLDVKALKTSGDYLNHEEFKRNKKNNNLTDLGQAPVMRGGTGKCEGACRQT